MYNAKARFYDPKLGRFLTQDSYLGQIDEPPSLHRYLYAANRPTFYIDPTGHATAPAMPPPVDGAALLRQMAEKKAAGQAAKQTGLRLVESAGAPTAEVAVETAVPGVASRLAPLVSGVLAWGGIAYESGKIVWACVETNRVMDDLDASIRSNDRFRRAHAEIIAANASKQRAEETLQRGKVTLEGEDAAEKAHEERRREAAQAGGAELGTAELSQNSRPRSNPRALDDPGMRELVEAIRARYPDVDIKVGQIRAGSDGRKHEIDIELPNAIIEVKGSRGANLGRQVTARMDPAINPSGKPVIGYSAHEKGLSRFTKAEIEGRGGIAADKPHLDTLLDILRPNTPQP